MEYNIKAIPTKYKGIEFRSRLEARWAAFFDACGWQWQYEPFDLDGWIPDFQLLLLHRSPLVEIKPITKYDHSVFQSVYVTDIHTAYDEGILLLGTSPFLDGHYDDQNWDKYDAIGYGVCLEEIDLAFDDESDRWIAVSEPTASGVVLFGQCYFCHKLSLVSNIGLNGYNPCFNCGKGCDEFWNGVLPSPISVPWNRACNLTKWRPNW